MKYRFVLAQTVLFVALFLLFNIMLFIPDYYAIRFESDTCERLGDDFQADNYPRSQGYYEQVCNSPVSGWIDGLQPPINLRAHLGPLIVSLVITLFYSYYRFLDREFRTGGED